MDDRLQRIKFLVEQSKLYANFLTESLKTEQPPPKKAKPNTKQKTITSFFAPSAQPKQIKVKLHKHQTQAVKWLTLLYEQGLNGILADEMGLGKTLEVIAFLSFLMENGVDGPFLVLAPLSTIGNWCDEITKFAPSITFTKYYGKPDFRSKLRKQRNKWGQIIITSYEVLMADAVHLQRVNWKYIIVDEGHRLKNIDSKLMRVLKQFKSVNRMLLTGTPLQNNLVELWALLNFLLPDVFTDLDIFHTWFESGEVNLEQNEEGRLVTSLHDILRPFLLRRLKRDVGLSLPPKREYVIFTKLTDLQQQLYMHLLNSTAREFVVEQIKKCGDDEQLVKNAKQQLRGKSFANLVMQLRLCCNSPYLFWDPWAPTATSPSNMEIDSRIENTSGKLILLHQLISKLKEQNHKVLIFTQFTKTLDLLEDWAIYRKYTYCRLDGQTSQSERQEMIREFGGGENDIVIFMLTTRSGGQGTNLVSADTVILFDSDWNPQQDLQAMDRVHRIGQTKPVIVYRLICGDTIEQNLLERASEKLELNHLVIESGQFKGPTNQSNGEKIADMNAQLHRHKLKFDKTSFEISEDEFNVILSRDIKSYSVDNPRVSERILCTSSTMSDGKNEDAQ